MRFAKPLGASLASLLFTLGGPVLTADSLPAVRVSWNANTEPDVYEYEVVARSASGSYRTLLKRVLHSTCSGGTCSTIIYPFDFGVFAGQTGYVKVSAIDDWFNKSLYSEEVSFTLPSTGYSYASSPPDVGVPPELENIVTDADVVTIPVNSQTLNVSNVSVNGESVVVEWNGDSWEGETQVSLIEGLNQILLTAVNSPGDVFQKEVSIIKDTTVPEVSMSVINEDGQSTLYVSYSDITPISAVVQEGSQVLYRGETNSSFGTLEIPLSKSGSREFKVSIQDVAGNQSNLEKILLDGESTSDSGNLLVYADNLWKGNKSGEKSLLDYISDKKCVAFYGEADTFFQRDSGELSLRSFDTTKISYYNPGESREIFVGYRSKYSGKLIGSSFIAYPGKGEAVLSSKEMGCGCEDYDTAIADWGYKVDRLGLKIGGSGPFYLNSWEVIKNE